MNRLEIKEQINELVMKMEKDGVDRSFDIFDLQCIESEIARREIEDLCEQSISKKGTYFVDKLLAKWSYNFVTEETFRPSDEIWSSVWGMHSKHYDEIIAKLREHVGVTVHENTSSLSQLYNL